MTVPVVADPDAAVDVTLEAVEALHAEHQRVGWAAVPHSVTVAEGAHVVFNSDTFIPAAPADQPGPDREPVEPCSDDERAACEEFLECFAGARRT